MSSAEDYDDEVTVFYRKSAAKVLGFLIGMGCDRGLAEEITDDAFLGARRYWGHVRTLDEPEGYDFKIARRERFKRQRAHDDRARDLQQNPMRSCQSSVMTSPRTLRIVLRCCRPCSGCLGGCAKQSYFETLGTCPRRRPPKSWESVSARW